ncbi:hypothetical protein BD410DRAFT_803144 [Rickenella mellea]|uniref:DUF6699 domain-containing protein n=1 Tax=Rickenella mellea TaxID=50990 RepID=A0A4Y7Q792_9AGAM|nr:hypothetical protein BD410DRAFT_803144 [Rickenella mellea]
MGLTFNFFHSAPSPSKAVYKLTTNKTPYRDALERKAVNALHSRPVVPAIPPHLSQAGGLRPHRWTAKRELITTAATHHLLAFNCAMFNHCEFLPPLIWDTRRSWRTARAASSPNHYLHPHYLSQYATNPPTPYFRITCGTFPRDWFIDVKMSRNSHGVTVVDVLRAIDELLRVRITPREWDKATEKHRKGVLKEHNRRCKSSRDPEYERRGGVRRVDWLGDRTGFVGLSPSYEASHTWNLTMKKYTHHTYLH